MKFADRLAAVRDRFGSDEAMRAALSVAADADELTQQSDAYYLSNISRRIFRAGLKHSFVDSRWPAFEEAFFGFEPEKAELLSESDLDERMKDTRLIRHWGKMCSIPYNAAMVREVSRAHGGFGRFLAQWPETDIVGLWRYLAKQGKQMGGQSGARFLRMVGKDTFLLTDDVVAALKAMGVVEKIPTSQKQLQHTQAFFNELAHTYSLQLCQLSQILAYSVG
ncbi:DNA-3-methyladenine glycosylase I [Hahella aquimaris]|uniref:DNA-3-methyladenine glycosylase I n=1 Tax=Hahella sp. HNIBRBA332 TaxID=3015983 RepID=UPI00273B0E95|nr:DNA-3-methyladenine glycosylase I [Hahella sp. HNIBRBA332]WLQ15338.1 DNA-3-methyladenine glycosylase I [Hahella sp. HNIBRBA332]